jgi:hypothetical protein
MAGAAIAVVDTRPGFDDTGVVAVLLVLAATIATLVMGGRRPASPVIATVLVGAWIPVAEWGSGAGPAALLALAFAALGAGIGVALGRMLPGDGFTVRPGNS